jgi:hypothetical protein
MAETLIRMRVLQAGTNDTGSHEVGDTITVDEPHAVLFELAGFAVRLEIVHVAAVSDAEAKTDGARSNRRRTR